MCGVIHPLPHTYFFVWWLVKLRDNFDFTFSQLSELVLDCYTVREMFVSFCSSLGADALKLIRNM
jgi:hypothetical protein